MTTKKSYKFYQIKAPILFIGTFTNPKSDTIKNSQFIVIESKDKKYQMRISLRFANSYKGFISTSIEEGLTMNAYDIVNQKEVAFKVEDLTKAFDLVEYTPPKSKRNSKEVVVF